MKSKDFKQALRKQAIDLYENKQDVTDFNKELVNVNQLDRFTRLLNERIASYEEKEVIVNLIETAYLKLEDHLRNKQPLNIQEIFQLLQGTIQSTIDTLPRKEESKGMFSFFQSKSLPLSSVLQNILLQIPPEYRIIQSSSKKSAAPH